MGAAALKDMREASDTRTLKLVGDDAVAWHCVLSDALAAGDGARAALAAVCEAVRSLVRCDRVQVWRGDLRQMAMHAVMATGYGEEEAARVAALCVPIAGMPLAPDLLRLKFLPLARVRGIGEYGDVLFGPFGIQAAAFLLLERGDRPLGAMQLSWCRDATPDFPAPELVQVIRRYAGLALDHHARTDEALQTAARSSETAMLLGTIHDPDELLPAMAAKVAEAVGCELGAVYLLDEPSGVFRYAAGTGPAPALDALRAVALEGAVVERALARAADDLLEVPDVAQHAGLRAYRVHRAVSSLLGLPLRRNGRVIGLLGVGYTTRSGRFARRQVALARSLAHHAVAALANARLMRSLRDVNELQSDLLAAVSHDLRTPLHILTGYSDMLLDDVGLGEPQRSIVKRMRQCSVDFLELIEGILAVARLDAGADRPAHARVALTDLCEAVDREVAELREPGVELAWTVRMPEIATDAPKLRMILRNLVTNALKFTKAGRVEVVCEATADGEAVSLRVKDTGPGIRPADREGLFERFKQGDAGRRVGGAGLGLGLYLVRRLAEVLGGTVALLCGDPGNTVFEVILPREHAARQRVGAGAAPSGGTTPGSPSSPSPPLAARERPGTMGA